MGCQLVQHPKTDLPPTPFRVREGELRSLPARQMQPVPTKTLPFGSQGWWGSRSVLLLVLFLAACGPGQPASTPATATARGRTASPPARSATPTARTGAPTGTKTPSVTVHPPQISWPTFDGGGPRSGVNDAERLITPDNVRGLTQLWHQALPDVVDSSPVELPHVATPAGVKDLLFVTTMAGSLLAIDTASGAQVWRQDTNGPGITNSSPAIDPSGRFVYSYGLDGKAHKYAVGSGNETTGGGWPATITLIPDVEKGSSALNIANGYLYVTISGYLGDGGHYAGHVVAVKLSSGARTVFNALCANSQQLLDSNSGDPNYCPDREAGIWARGGAVVDPVTGNVFVVTGNGPYNASSGGHDYGDSVLELSPDLTKLVDSYTPDNYAQLEADDADLGSTAPVLLPRQVGSSTPYLTVQAGKDNKLRLLNRRNLSGKGGPNHVGGEVQTVDLPQGCNVLTQPVAWNNGGVTWVFVANNCGLSAFTVVTADSGQSHLQFAYLKRLDGTSPFLANGILFLQGGGVLRAMQPATGRILWSSAGGALGPAHWQSPIVINGHVYTADNSGQLLAFGFR